MSKKSNVILTLFIFSLVSMFLAPIAFGDTWLGALWMIDSFMFLLLFTKLGMIEEDREEGRL